MHGAVVTSGEVDGVDEVTVEVVVSTVQDRQARLALNDVEPHTMGVVVLDHSGVLMLRAEQLEAVLLVHDYSVGVGALAPGLLAGVDHVPSKHCFRHHVNTVSDR